MSPDIEQLLREQLRGAAAGAPQHLDVDDQDVITRGRRVVVRRRVLTVAGIAAATVAIAGTIGILAPRVVNDTLPATPGPTSTSSASASPTTSERAWQRIPLPAGTGEDTAVRPIASDSDTTGIEFGKAIADEYSAVASLKSPGRWVRGDGGGAAFIYGWTPDRVTTMAMPTGTSGGDVFWGQVRLANGTYAVVAVLPGFSDSEPLPTALPSWTDASGATHKIVAD